ncbi:hypothetical protein RXV86_10670 [Alisedimentitalea sp. MJ-SS2]|uniref:hypothetical protein n=1 Tax=Aliisedimentitalea sp. MJ-SS2 TaxID=3049795 RepID=UPI0029120E86|nr:hypothetical protein [Alisedimentitalea sp. MJ-SS2]MDU8927846.1 hypothetical protein [Alisedimentitalea sp. MJ-SS2]
MQRALPGLDRVRFAAMPQGERPWYGPALLAQAGVAVGMRLVAAQVLPGQGEVILILVIGSAVVFEILGPVATAMTIRRAA